VSHDTSHCRHSFSTECLIRSKIEVTKHQKKPVTSLRLGYQKPYAGTVDMTTKKLQNISETSGANSTVDMTTKKLQNTSETSGANQLYDF
jgi:hypothetical protein